MKSENTNSNIIVNVPTTIGIYVATVFVCALTGHLLSRLFNRWF